MLIVQNIGSGGRTDFSFTVLRDDFARRQVLRRKDGKENRGEYRHRRH